MASQKFVETISDCLFETSHEEVRIRKGGIYEVGIQGTY